MGRLLSKGSYHLLEGLDGVRPCGSDPMLRPRRFAPLLQPRLCPGVRPAGSDPAQRLIQLRPQRLQRLLVRLPDDVDLGVVGDGLQGDVRRALVDEALADVAAQPIVLTLIHGNSNVMANSTREAVVINSGRASPGNTFAFGASALSYLIQKGYATALLQGPRSPRSWQ